MQTETHTRRRRISNFPLCDAFILGFAVWTIVCNLTALMQGSLLRLLLSAAFVSILLGLWLWKRRKQGFFIRMSGSIPEEPRSIAKDRMQSLLFWTLVVAAVGLTLVAHRPDADDAHYVNLAVGVVDHPQLSILHYDTKHSIPGDLLSLPVTKVVSIEMLAAGLSLLTTLPAIVFLHLVFPPLAAMLTMLAYRRFFRILVPVYWAYGVLAVFVFLCANGDVHRTYGNFSFVRFQQGKGIFLTVVLPLILVYGLRFAQQPNRRNWLLLSSAQIAAIGLTSTALWVAPVVAAFAVLTGLPRMLWKEQLKRLIVGLTASGYVVGIGLYVTKVYQMPVRAVTTKLTSHQLFDNSIELVFGHGYFALLCLMLVLTAWSFCETRVGRRLCLIFPLGLFLLFANPFSARFVAQNITGVATYWRVFWLLPLPAMAGLVLLFPLVSRWKLPLGRTGRYLLYFLLLLIVFGLLPERHIFSQVPLAVPGLKVPSTYQIAVFLRDSLPDHPNVLGPEAVTAWLTTMHKHPYPLLGRKMYARKYGEEGQRRLALKYYIEGKRRPKNATKVLQEALQQYHVAAVCVPRSNPWAKEIRDMLRKSGFVRKQILVGHGIWFRSTR